MFLRFIGPVRLLFQIPVTEADQVKSKTLNYHISDVLKRKEEIHIYLVN